MDTDRARFDHLGPAAAATGRAALDHRRLVYSLVAMAVVLSWVVLVFMAGAAAQRGLPAELGPGAGILRGLPELPLPPLLERFVALCLSPAPPGEVSIPLLLALWGMWMLMALAMMLPAAAPMLRTYCEIADTARAGGHPVVHPLVLVAGYLAVWGLASLCFAAMALALQAVTANASAAAPVTAMAAAAALAIAGLYQFSRLKEACLEKCRNPFAILFSNWSTRSWPIFRLGLRQGLWCLGCCWALMLVMFAVGLMNVFWMALMALVAIGERQLPGRAVGKVAGAILLVWAGGLLLVSL
ncbi:MAG: DUF2182 domain-containing protein [Rhizobiaceae bacterium]